MKFIWVDGQPWSRGWQNSQAGAAMTQAAFAVLRGEPVPNDPILGKPYVWDPATRTLSPPDDPFYQKLQTKPIAVPVR